MRVVAVAAASLGGVLLSALPAQAMYWIGPISYKDGMTDYSFSSACKVSYGGKWSTNKAYTDVKTGSNCQKSVGAREYYQAAIDTAMVSTDIFWNPSRAVTSANFAIRGAKPYWYPVQ